MEGLVPFGFAEGPGISGAVYRYLREMEQDGWVVSEWDTEATAGPARRVYRLTAEGERALSWWIADLRETDKALHRLFDAYEEQVQGTRE
jgi:DNA-binding PadR family transcriptional regulator